MGVYTVQSLRNDYVTKWVALQITKPASVDGAGDKIIANKSRYQTIEQLTGVPWYVVGIIHYRESDCNFHTHLHNGDPLGGRTYHVPTGRPLAPPKSGHLPYTFEESAVDALQIEGFTKIKLWNVEQICYAFEQYNGWGYRYHHTPSAYLYSDTNQYHSGKYVSDGVFDYAAVDQQVGCIGILKYIVSKENIILPTDAPLAMPTPDTMPAPLPQPPVTHSPKADVPKPSGSEMRQKSRKYWWTTVAQWLAGLFGGGGAVVQTAQTLNLDVTKSYAQTIKDTADIIGTWGIVALCIAILAYVLYMKYLMKQDVQEGRATPSAGDINGSPRYPNAQPNP